MEIKFINRKCRNCGNKFPTKVGLNKRFCCVECEYLWNKKNGKYKKGRGPSFEYICRRLTTMNKTGDAYGITIPAYLVDKFDLLYKKFKIDITEKGIFIIKTKIEYVEMK